MTINKKPVGRPRIAENARMRRSVMIDDADMAIILQLGNGNQSAGVHALVEFYISEASRPILAKLNAKH
jgi:hypothetical protein